MEKHIASNVTTALLLLEKQSKHFLEILMLLFSIAESFSKDKVRTRSKITLRSPSTRSSKIKICLKQESAATYIFDNTSSNVLRPTFFNIPYLGKKSWGKVTKFFASD